MDNSKEGSPNENLSEKERKENFDGHIVIDVDDAYLHGNIDDRKIVLFAQEQLANIALLDVQTLMLRKTWRKLIEEMDETMARTDIPSEEQPKFSQYLSEKFEAQIRRANDIYKKMQLQYGKAIAEIIEEGRLKMSLLIDTDGGIAHIGRMITVMARNIESRQGEVSSYVPYKAHSTGANIFLAASKRYTTPDATFMWHPSYEVDEKGNPKTEYEMEIYGDEDYSISETVERFYKFLDIKDSLIEKAHSWAQPKIEEKFDDVLCEHDLAITDSEKTMDLESSLDVHFTAKELHEFGIITETFPSNKALAGRYYKGCRSFTEKMWGWHFFTFSRFFKWLEERKMKKQTKLLPRL